MSDYVIYALSTKALRGIFTESRKNPLGINGENLDVIVANMNKKELDELKHYNYLISWLEEVIVDTEDALKFKGYKLNKSDSRLYFKDKFMSKKNNFFNAENANEGVLHVLFYLTLFISELTPHLFAIDNIENSLNPHLCREISKAISHLAIEKNKQVLMTTHNPAILDGLNLNDDRIRLFEVFRNDKGQTKTRRIKINADNKPEKLKLSELWMRGYLGAISQNF
jgi:AAA15 family ATPase/GTPase